MKRVFLFLVVFTAVAAADDFKTVGNHKLYDDCKQLVRWADGNHQLNDHEFTQAALCTGYMIGFSDGVTVTGHDFRQGPALVSAEAYARSFVGYLNSHPAEIDSDSPGPMLIKAWAHDGLIVTLSAEGK